MPKQIRKRKHEEKDVEIEIIVPKTKFKPFDAEAQAEEEKLTKILFGGASSFLQSLEEAEQEPAPSSSCIDSGLGETDSDDSDKIRAPAWVDEEDDGIDVGEAANTQGRRLPDGGISIHSNQYSDFLKHKFTSLVGTPSWAALDKVKHDSDSDDEILQTCGFIQKPTAVHLPSTTIEFKKVKDINCETYSEGPYINSVEFHPTSSVSLVAGNSGIATLFAVDGKRNNKLHSVSFQRYPIICAKFGQAGNEAILGSRQSHIFSYDLMLGKAIRIPLPNGLTQCKNFVMSPDGRYMAVAGKWGEVHLLSAATKERIHLLKQDAEVSALSFNPAGNLLFGHSDTSEVTVWDMNMKRVKHKFNDNGCIQGTTMDICASNQFIATGSAQGVVNLYDMNHVLSSKNPKPLKSILNLTTSISTLKFNSTSEVLALASAEIENSIRLFHLASSTVFSNFPSFGTKLGHINALNYSPASGYLALGNKKSTVALYRLKHFKSY